MSFYSQMALAALGLLKSKGQVMTLVRSTVGAYNTSTGAAAETSVNYSVNGVSISMPSAGIGQTSVERGDKKVIIESGVVVPSLSDSMIIQGIEHELLDVKTVDPSGEAVIYILHCRSGG